jgi:hypothetical protein
MSTAGFEPVIPERDRPQTNTFDGADNGVSLSFKLAIKITGVSCTPAHLHTSHDISGVSKSKHFSTFRHSITLQAHNYFTGTQ